MVDHPKHGEDTAWVVDRLSEKACYACMKLRMGRTCMQGADPGT